MIGRGPFSDRRGPAALAGAAAIVVLATAAVLTSRAASAEAARRAAPPLAPPTNPVPGEDHVFHSTTAHAALALDAPRLRDAHPRTLATYRRLRAYPGAPPSIPHGFTADEFRTGACRTCHERGGYSMRFGAYVPLTPHPEMSACLSCHVGNDALTGVQLPTFDPNARCLQCHAKGGLIPVRDALFTVLWPTIVPHATDSPPPDIPHSVQWRTDCLACHSGPSAVREIRTDHPFRANCRQCHLATFEADLMERAIDRGSGGGAPR